MKNIDMNVFKDDVLNTINDSLLVLDSGLNVIYANEPFYHQFKTAPDETVNKRIYEIGSGQFNIPELRRLLEDILPSKSSFFEFSVKHDFPAIGQRIMLVNAKELIDGSREEKFILVVMEDITEITRLYEASLHANKLAVIGQLSAGIAHGLSSPLTGIHNFLDVYAKEEPKESIRHHELMLMLEACNYMSKIVKNLNYFARTSREEHKKISLADIIDSTLAFTERQFIASNIQITRYIPKDVKDIIGNKGQMQHVLLNILMNSKDAIMDGGKISIKARNSDQTNTVILEIADNGKGMAKKDLQHVFEPFFTTKQIGGTGLGLPAAYGIVKEHHGEIRIESEEGKGTRVIITLPSAV
jgi:two-component system CheB/CheR fusion protein